MQVTQFVLFQAPVAARLATGKELLPRLRGRRRGEAEDLTLPDFLSPSDVLAVALQVWRDWGVGIPWEHAWATLGAGPAVC